MAKKLPLHNQLSQWFDKSLGRALLASEKVALETVWSYLTGEYLLMLGAANQESLMESAQLLMRCVVTPTYEYASKKFPTVCAAYEDFPFLQHAIDAVLLPHTLEFTSDPYRVLRTVAKSIKPDGHLIIIGFNPFSLWGLRALFSLGRHAPWSGHFRRAARIKDWLKVLNFEVVEQKRTAHCMPFCYKGTCAKYSFFTRFLRSCLPILGGVYVIVAQKKTYSMTPLESRWKRVRAKIQNGFAEPVIRS